MDDKKFEAAIQEENASISAGGARITRTRLRSKTKTIGVNAPKSALRTRQRIKQPQLNNWALAWSFPAQGGCRP